MFLSLSLHDHPAGARDEIAMELLRAHDWTSKFYHSILSILPSLLLYVIITAGFHDEQPIGDL